MKFAHQLFMVEPPITNQTSMIQPVGCIKVEHVSNQSLECDFFLFARLGL